MRPLEVRWIWRVSSLHCTRSTVVPALPARATTKPGPQPSPPPLHLPHPTPKGIFFLSFPSPPTCSVSVRGILMPRMYLTCWGGCGCSEGDASRSGVQQAGQGCRANAASGAVSTGDSMAAASLAVFLSKTVERRHRPRPSVKLVNLVCVYFTSNRQHTYTMMQQQPPAPTWESAMMTEAPVMKPEMTAADRKLVIQPVDGRGGLGVGWL